MTRPAGDKGKSALTRRGFLAVSSAGGAGLLIGFHLFGCRDSKSTGSRSDGEAIKVVPPSELNAWVKVGADEQITLLVAESEMGQGVLTALPMVLAEELDADWSKVRAEHAPTDETRYGSQSTGGSTSVRRGVDNLRKVGASARAMLIGAAAKTWEVPPGECRTAKGVVTHPSGKRATYGALAELAATIDPPDDPPLKRETEWRIIGQSLARLDIPDKVDGRAVFGIDVRLPELLTAQIEHPPVWGAKVVKVDDSAAKKVPGVRDVVQVPTGVAVVADHYWAAHKGRAALKVTWNEGPIARLSSDTISAELAAAAKKGVEAHRTGNPARAIGSSPARRRLSAVYEVPYLAHAPMEPLNCTARVTKDRCEVWAATQSPGRARKLAAEIAGLSEDKVEVTTTLLGGGFGRRSQNDFVADAVHISKAVQKPVKVVWTREDGIRSGWYRPVAYNAMRGAVDAKGWPIAWEHQIAGPSILARLVPKLRGGIDGTSTEGAANLPYAIPNVRVSWAKVDVPIPIWFWRSVGSTQNAYCTECFLDELAALGGKDPLEVRLRLLADEPRHKRVLEVAAEKAGWGAPLGEGKARGLAVHECFGSFVAQVVEVSIEKQSRVRVHRVVCAIDCGKVINPDTVTAQVESGIVYGLTSGIYGAIDIEGGRAVQSNFHDYRMLRMPEMPKVETHLVPSGDPWGGVGEPATPVITPAVVNGLFALTKKPIRKLPIARNLPRNEAAKAVKTAG